MAAEPRTPPSPAATPPRPPQGSRPPRQQPPRPPARRQAPPPRLMPDDSLFRASLARLDDDLSTDVDRRFAALAPLPTPVEPEQCTQMWIPAGRVTADHHLREILASLDSDSQPQMWRDAKPHLRDFYVTPHRGISFVCTSDQALQRLGGVELVICGTPVTIRRYSNYDKLYYVDLQRLPADTSDRAIYDWFVDRSARPILITPSHGVGQLISRARTVYFNAVQCPATLFEPNGEPLREIFFADGEKPCFVQHKLHRFNRVKPPSLRQPPRKSSVVSDASMRNPDDATQRTGSPRDSSDVSPPLDSSGATSSLDSSGQPSGRTRSLAAESHVPRMILGSVSVQEPEWRLVQHSQHGILDRREPFLEPEGAVPCDLSTDPADPHALVYTFPVSPNTYEVLSDEGYDTSLPPDVDITVTTVDEDGMTTTVSGFTADSSLLPRAEEVRTLKSARQMDLKVQHVSVAELQQAIDEFVDKEVLTYTTHDDVLAAIQVQPAYFRRIFRLPVNVQEQLFRAHAVYRTICAEPLLEDESSDALARLQRRYGVDSPDAAAFFDHMFPEKPRQDAALHSALCDLFWMIFAPSVYIDPVKIQAIIPDRLPP
ncbi:hypothetical protein PR001_g29281, partial [Phytophthora rubi]